MEEITPGPGTKKGPWAAGWGFVGRRVQVHNTAREDLNGLEGIIQTFNHGEIKCELPPWHRWAAAAGMCVAGADADGTNMTRCPHLDRCGRGGFGSC